ncbi:MAG: hypothetical protein D3908_16040 [Candidatus Electrothrix sp. AUS4]|nr:hypothetical protein [Candidatus Electrothrix sp. AUS4]
MSRKKWLSAGALCLSVFAAHSAQAKEGNQTWYVNGGVSYFNMDPDLPRDLGIHSTHPDDRSFMSGSPGSTKLDDVDITFFNLEIGHSWPVTIELSDNLMWGVSYVLKVPVSEDGREEKKNENDTRPATESSFIYTELSDVSCQHEVGIKVTWWQAVSNTDFQYSITPGLYLGYWQMAFAKGWDRFGRDQVEAESDAGGFSISPQIAFTLDTSNLNFTVFTGYRAISLDYDYDSMDSSSATGVELGASVGWKF